MEKLNGFFLVDKEKNFSTYDIIRKLKKKFPNQKIGHSGTLDPITTGIVVIAIGKATKYLPELSENAQKEYIAKIQFGIKTDTGDITGNIIEENSKIISEKSFKEKLSEYQNYEYAQIPPIYSAKKINGKRAYEYARNGQKVELKAKNITVYNSQLLEFNEKQQWAVVKFRVSKGSYIRSLIEDIAEDLQTVATMSELRRTETDGFKVEDAFLVENIKNDMLYQLSDYLKNIYIYQINVESKVAELCKNGVSIKNEYIIEKFDEILENKINQNLLIVEKDTNKIIGIYQKEDEKYKCILNLWGI